MQGKDFIPLGLRVLCAIGALLYIIGAFTNLIRPNCYTVWITALYAVLAGFFVLITEFSPLGLSKLLKVVPFVGEYFGRGLLYIGFGLMTLGGEMGGLSIAGGAILIASGVGSLALHFVMPADEQGGYAMEDGQGVFTRYEEETDGGGQYGQL
uniref:COPI associated protein n=1 Tax=Chromera velia CCMP2878 TaxID=1169474 RepID=A0A0G4F4E1_9ALVE|mmetsp:Transcript_7661/g.14936  ORF Transcript_7661/g.14936 Transcript_7661/m.14936 type:complete len:153 (+) Transcript_7661:62-520(+)|eukprot:Cvel_15175.t1-p1 / transcript=Cvel_15175.t1 / gene=Cvel_15175 / organism=Chromera_velia_CCMP2878 / gene_product=hypothetical protein / transcript_product=hypothetical protein / location=Cvel_scaffold1109:14596-17009(-) / protein_length=152 / sequence_SO=supercontig / SO=protein_coding / is_pseudo=false